MGLSVAISGGIILTVLVLILLSLPGFMEKIFSIGDITTQVTHHEQKISNTKISMKYLSQSVGSSRVNFTLGNDGSEKLWNFIDFDLFIEYTGTISGKRTEQLSYNGECLGVVPQVGQWCIQSISNDIVDPKILNSREQASVWTNLSQNLASNTAIVTLVTDNGVTFTTADPTPNTLESLTNVTNTGCALNQIIKVNSTGFWDCADPTWTTLVDTRLGAAAASIGGSWSGSYEKLQFTLMSKGASAAGIPFLRFNGDAGAASYSWNDYGIIATTIIDAQDSSDSEIQLTGTTSDTDPMIAVCDISNFSDTRKQVACTLSRFDPIGTNGGRWSPGGQWADTASSITQVDISRSAGNWNSGARLIVLGMK